MCQLRYAFEGLESCLHCGPLHGSDCINESSSGSAQRGLNINETLSPKNANIEF